MDFAPNDPLDGLSVVIVYTTPDWCSQEELNFQLHYTKMLVYHLPIGANYTVGILNGITGPGNGVLPLFRSTYCVFIYHSPSLDLLPLVLSDCLRADSADVSASIIEDLKSLRCVLVIFKIASNVFVRLVIRKFLSGFIL